MIEIVCSENEDTLRYQFHKEVYEISSKSCLSLGFRKATKGENLCKTLSYRIGSALSVVTIVFFSAGSMMFASLALEQTISDLELQKKAPIIGHFSEWSMLGIFALKTLSDRCFYYISMGKEEKICTVFKHFLASNKLSFAEQNIIYKEFKKTLNDPSSSSPFTFSHFIPEPQTHTDLGNSLIELDHSLKDLYQKMEREYQSFSFIHQINAGWRVIAKNKSKKQLAFIKTVFLLEGIFFASHLANYFAGIFWSAEQAVNDEKEGLNPSIGGHSLEWTAETMAMLNIFYLQLEEIANVGKCQLGIDLVRKNISQIKKETPDHWTKQCKQLVSEGYSFIKKIPKGFFFNWPTYYLYEKVE